jgi:hypothetical protein
MSRPIDWELIRTYYDELVGNLTEGLTVFELKDGKVMPKR